MKAEIPDVVIVKVTVNNELADELLEAGFNRYQPIREFTETSVEFAARQEARKQERFAEARERGLDPLRFAITVPKFVGGQKVGTMLVGRTVGDSGTPIFGRQGQTRVSLKHVLDDIWEQFKDFSLVSLNVQRRDQEKNWLWLVYAGPEDPRTAITPTGAERFHLGRIMGRIYQNCHVWRNPGQGTVTINVGAPQGDDTPGAKDLRIYEKGLSIRCVER